MRTRRSRRSSRPGTWQRRDEPGELHDFVGNVPGSRRVRDLGDRHDGHPAVTAPGTRRRARARATPDPASACRRARRRPAARSAGNRRRARVRTPGPARRRRRARAGPAGCRRRASVRTPGPAAPRRGARLSVAAAPLEGGAEDERACEGAGAEEAGRGAMARKGKEEHVRTIRACRRRGWLRELRPHPTGAPHPPHRTAPLTSPDRSPHPTKITERDPDTTMEPTGVSPRTGASRVSAGTMTSGAVPRPPRADARGSGPRAHAWALVSSAGGRAGRCAGGENDGRSGQREGWRAGVHVVVLDNRPAGGRAARWMKAARLSDGRRSRLPRRNLATYGESGAQRRCCDAPLSNLRVG